MKGLLSIIFCAIMLGSTQAQTRCELPFVLFNGHTSGAKVTLQEVKYAPGLLIKVEGVTCYDYKITGFNTRFYIDGHCYTSTETGSAFTTEIKNEMAKAKPGSVLIFENIIVQSPNGKRYNIEPIMVTVY